MKNEFPSVAVEYIGDNTGDGTKFFSVSLPKVDLIGEDAATTFISRSSEFDITPVLREYDKAMESAFELFAVAVASCDSCPVKKRGVCDGIKNTNLNSIEDYQATLKIPGPNNAETITEQLSGAKCGISANQLNKSQVKAR